MTKFVLGTAGVLFTILILTLLSFYSAFVFTVLWGWFVVPLGVPAIGLFHALGLGIVFLFPFINMLMTIGQIHYAVEKPKGGLTDNIVSTLAKGIGGFFVVNVFFLFAFIYQLFM